MRTVALPGTDLTTSRLGYGSAALMARLSRRESLRLLEVAHESGVTHFDTARAYGYGEAEGALGEFLADRRDGVTLATKLGIAPPRSSGALRVAKAGARAAARVAPALRPLLRRGASSMSATGAFEPAQARASLETSLRELRVDTIDLLLLHECAPADLRDEGLRDLLEGAVREGTVRHVGIATDRDSTAAILAAEPAGLVSVAQVRQTVLDPPLPVPAGVGVLTHSAVAPLIGPLSGALRDESLRRRWREELGLEPAGSELGRLLLAAVVEPYPDRVVLFSSTDESRLRGNAALGDAPAFSDDQLARFRRLAAELLSPGGPR